MWVCGARMKDLALFGPLAAASPAPIKYFCSFESMATWMALKSICTFLLISIVVLSVEQVGPKLCQDLTQNQPAQRLARFFYVKVRRLRLDVNRIADERCDALLNSDLPVGAKLRRVATARVLDGFQRNENAIG